MTIFSLEDLDRASVNKPIKYRRDVLKMSRKIGDNAYMLSTESFDILSARYKNKTSLRFKIESFWTHLSKNIIFFIHKRKILTEKETKENRLSICKNCPELNSLSFCRVCGCNMKIKAGLIYAECPLKKW